MVSPKSHVFAAFVIWFLLSILTMSSQSSLEELKASLPSSSQEALNFEPTQWAFGSVFNDSFYTVDANTSSAAPGSLLKLEKKTNTSAYSLPPATALSRFIYQSKTFSGELVPVSAFILWPYAARSAADGYQIIAWAHGTAGLTPDTAPSHIKNLWQHYLAPFTLAMQGYVIVATDYAGLGVSRTGTNGPIDHEYLAGPAPANDVFYSVQAAQTAFPELSKHFAVAGHSQGGHAAWAVAQRQAIEPVDGYLGTVALSPVTNLLKEPSPMREILMLGAIFGFPQIYPSFDLSEVLNDAGVQRIKLLREVGGNTATIGPLLADQPYLRNGWTENPTVVDFVNRTMTGDKRIAGPLLVVQGESDVMLDFNVTKAAVESTSAKFPDAHIEFVSLPGVSHPGALTSCLSVWQEWIAQRYAGVPTAKGLKRTMVKAAAPVDAYQADLNWWIAPAIEFYQTP